MTEIIIAMDFSSKKEVDDFLEHFPNDSLYLKIGMELFYKEGKGIVEDLKAKGHKIFLDLKLHDIPNTVEKAMRNIAAMGVDMCNVHAAGGLEMMKAARRGLGDDTLLIAVSQLTSTSEKDMQKEQLVNASLNESVLNYSKLAYEAGLDGMVCSAKEVAMIHENIDSSFLCITPGIRPKSFAKADQKRVVSPKEAKEIGSNYIVVGRPITSANNPYQAYKEIEKELE